MPKSTKKQKEKAADFTKARLKLGKRKKPAPNAVDTSFKTRAITLPSQGILVDKSQAGPSTRRKQTLDELLSLLKHYSPGTRRDALAGLRELFSEHPEILELSTASVVQSCSRLIGDEDTTVRKSLLLFIEWLLPRIPKTNLVPHIPSLLLYTTSAQTHIFPEIRVDAVQLLDTLLQVVPEYVVLRGPSDHGNRVLQGYLGLLNISGRQNDDQAPPSGVVLSASSKLLVLNSLNTFLELSTSIANTTRPEGDQEEPWFLAPSFATETAYQNFIHTIQPLRSLQRPFLSWQGLTGASLSAPFSTLVDGVRPWSALDLNDAEGLLGSLERVPTLDDYPEGMTSLARSLHPILISTFLDNAPAALIPTSSSSKSSIIGTKLVYVVGRLARALYSPILRKSSLIDGASFNDLKAFLNYLSTYFPFGAEGVFTQDPQVEDILHDLNLIYCELASLLILNEQLLMRVESHQASATQRPKGVILDAPFLLQLVRINDWVVKALSGQLKSTSKPMGQQLTPESCRSLLPTVWALLNQRTNNSKLQGDQPTVQIKILVSLFDQWEKIGPSSAVKRVLLEIIAYFALLETDSSYTGNFKLTTKLPPRAVVPNQLPSKRVQLFTDWVLTLPRMAWELGASNPPTTQMIFSFLLRALQRKSIIFGTSVLVQLMQRLTPYFTINHPTRGLVMGPFIKLPDSTGKRNSVRNLVLDTVWTLAQVSTLQLASRQITTRPPGESTMIKASKEGLCASVTSATRGTSEETYWSALSVQPL